MIKRTAALLLTIAYAITTMGFAFDLHYCCNRLVSVTINTPAKSCSMAAASKSKCCKNSHLKIKVKDAHQPESGSFLSGIFSVEMPQQFLAGYFTFRDHLPAIHFEAHDPPYTSCRNHLKNCVFRI